MTIFARGVGSALAAQSPGFVDLKVQPATGATRAGNRMLQVGPGWFPERRGGAENVYYNLFRELQTNGFEVRGVVPGTQQAERETEGRVRTYEDRGRSLLSRSIAIRRVSRELFGSQTDIVGSHFALCALPVLDRIGQKPFVVHFHGPWALESATEGGGALSVRTKMAIETAVYRRADRIIVLSDAFGRILRQHYGIPAAVIRRVPGGVDCGRLAVSATRDAARERLRWERNRPIVLAVRRLVRRMGMSNLIQAMAMLRRSNGDAVLYIAGTGPERAVLESQAESSGLSNSVRFVGALSDADLALAYRAADITIVPTAALEGFGLIAAESLAAGTPVLVTPVGGLPEVVSGLSERLVLPDKDPAGIANGLAHALDHPSSLPNSEACARYARANFDWAHVGGQVASIYREVLGTQDRQGAPQTQPLGTVVTDTLAAVQLTPRDAQP
jgi:glycosyltransferase involved in cell wall biosynthesis